MDLGITAKRAVVAASSAGLGFSVAKALHAEGCDVVICGRDPDRLDAAAAKLPGAIALQADVGTAAGAASFMADAIAALGGEVDILVTNAGGPPKGTARELESDQLTAAIDLTLQSTVAMCRAVVDGMASRGWGRIVGITSQSVRQPMPDMVLSNTVRAAVTAYFKTLAMEVAADGITVNTIQPGRHRTSRMVELEGDDLDAVGAALPVGHLGDPDDFGAITAFLCSARTSFITGAAIPVDGGYVKGLL